MGSKSLPSSGNLPQQAGAAGHLTTDLVCEDLLEN